MSYGFSQLAGDIQMFFVTSQRNTINVVFGKGSIHSGLKCSVQPQNKISWEGMGKGELCLFLKIRQKKIERELKKLDMKQIMLLYK